MNDYKDLQGYPLQAGQGAPFAGRLVDSERNENGVFVRIPFDMLNNAGLYGTNKVEVWGKQMERYISVLQQDAKYVNVELVCTYWIWGLRKRIFV
ncbi:hypothetical protein FORC13_2781 [Bacillus cereus]|nr:hypothetical protein FORC13_2781 [Bacillus cereus]